MEIHRSKHFFYILAGALILMMPALYNGFPLVYVDSGTYIKSGMELSVPLDRPVMYGLFIRLASLNESLWLVILAQCMILSYVLSLCYKTFSGSNPGGNTWLFMIAFLTAFTGIGWYSGQLMPDIYTAIAVMCGLLLLVYQRLTILERILTSVILIFSECVHFSNFAICILVLLVLFVFAKTKLMSPSVVKEIRFLMLTAVLASGILISSLVNYSIGGRFGMNQASHVFLMGRMLDAGLLEKFLNEKCAANNYILCDCKDQLPADSRAFLWSGESPLYRDGGWEKSSYEYNRILKDMFTSPKYLVLFTYRGILSGFSQLFQNQIGGSGLEGNYNDGPDTPVAQQIAIHFRQEQKPYHQSRQNTNLWEQGLDFSVLNMIYYPLLTLTVLFLFFIRSVKQIWDEISSFSKLLFTVLITGILINAFVTGTLASVCDRFQGRIGWLFVFTAVLLVMKEKGVLFEFVYRRYRRLFPAD